MDPAADQDQLINYRLTWLGAFSGLLAGAVALAMNAKQAGSLIGPICLLGTAVALSTYVGTLAANLVLWKRAREYRWPRLWMFWLMPGNVLPPIVGLWWLWLWIELPSATSGPAISAAISVNDASTLTSIAAVVGALTGCISLVAVIVQEVRRRRARRANAPLPAGDPSELKTQTLPGGGVAP